MNCVEAKAAYKCAQLTLFSVHHFCVCVLFAFGVAANFFSIIFYTFPVNRTFIIHFKRVLAAQHNWNVLSEHWIQFRLHLLLKRSVHVSVRASNEKGKDKERENTCLAAQLLARIKSKLKGKKKREKKRKKSKTKGTVKRGDYYYEKKRIVTQSNLCSFNFKRCTQTTCGYSFVWQMKIIIRTKTDVKRTRNMVCLLSYQIPILTWFSVLFHSVWG